MNTTPAGPPNEQDRDGAFGWLGHEGDGEAERARADTQPRRTTVIDQAEPEHRLDPLAVNTYVNRGLVIVLCIVAVGLTFQTLRSIGSSGSPDTKSTNVSPTTAPAATPTSSPARKPKVVVSPPTTTAKPPVTAQTTPTFPPATVQAAPPATAPRRTIRATAPIQAAPVQAVAVPVTTPQVTAPPDTVAVPYTPTP